MKMLFIELKKERRTGVIAILFLVGVLGALYAFANFAIRGETLLNLPLEPMDILLTQLYGMLMVLNMFAIIVAACMIYNMEFMGNAVKKMYMLPISVEGMFFCKFFIMTIMLFLAIVIQNLALTMIGVHELSNDAFSIETLVKFAVYTFFTSMPVLGFMMLVASCAANMWIPLGIGVAGFLSGMALATYENSFLLLHPFIVMLKPAVAMSAAPDMKVLGIAIAETIVFLLVGIGLAKYVRFE